MTVALLSFLALALFVIHEFEEIIRIRSWIEQYRNDRAHGGIFIKNQQAYPSTETISIMILEEIVLVTATLSFAIAFASYAVVLAVIIANTLHLVGHITDAIRAKRWTPGSVTAAITGATNIVLFAYVFVTKSPSVLAVSVAVLAFGVPMVLNLILLQKYSGRIERWRLRLAKHR